MHLLKQVAFWPMGPTSELSAVPLSDSSRKWDSEMKKPESALLLIGSPRRKAKSTSESLGSYLLDRLQRKGIKTAVEHIQRSLLFAGGLESLVDQVRDNDLIIVSFPLYVDCLPAPLIRLFEAIADDGRERPTSDQKSLVAIVNCGFPEAVHTRTAIAICHQFAAETGMQWLGGLGLGGGEAIAGRRLEKVGFLARNPRRALDLAAEALAGGQTIAKESENLMAKPLMPSRLYRWIGNLGWKREARRRGNLDHLNDRPFEPE
jgi:multimeric flavodoxin WrbA